MPSAFSTINNKNTNSKNISQINTNYPNTTRRLTRATSSSSSSFSSINNNKNSMHQRSPSSTRASPSDFSINNNNHNGSSTNTLPPPTSESNGTLSNSGRDTMQQPQASTSSTTAALTKQNLIAAATNAINQNIQDINGNNTTNGHLRDSSDGQLSAESNSAILQQNKQRRQQQQGPASSFDLGGPDGAAPVDSEKAPLDVAAGGVPIPPPGGMGSPTLSTMSNVSEANPYVAAGVLDPLTLPVDARKTVLILMFILKTITSYDAGAFSLSIGAKNGIEQELEMDSAQSGFLGSSVYLGNVVGCALCAWLFHKYDAKYLLCIGMILHTVFTVLFALSMNYFFAVLSRIGIGFTLSFVVVYSVVWADVFSPKANATLWLAVLNIGVPVGTLAGFLTGGFVMNSAVYSWRWIFFIKSILMVPIIVFMGHVDQQLIDDPLSGTSKERVSTPHLDVWNSFLSNKLMILNVGGLSVLYFVVTGMQVFFTQYLGNPPFNASVNDIMVTFGITAVSAPIFGVAIGGWAMDKYGNYREHPDRAANLGTVAGVLAAIFGVFTTMSTNLTTLSFNLWFLLFFGAAALPSAMGLIVAAVPPTQKNAASSFANIMFNIWGYFAGPMFCGFVAKYTGSLNIAMTATLNMGWVGVIFFFFSSRVAKAQVEARLKEQQENASKTYVSSGDGDDGQQQQQQEMSSVVASPSGESTISYPRTPRFDTTTTEE